MTNQSFIIEKPQRVAVSRAEPNGNRFLVLPLEPALAYSDGKPAMQLMVVEKGDVLLQAFLSATVTLPMGEPLLQSVRQEVMQRYPDIQDPQSITFARWDIASCAVTLQFDKEASLVMSGSFQGVGEPRVLLQKSLTTAETAALKILWEKGLPDAVIHYSIVLPTGQQMATAAVQNVFKAHFALGQGIRTAERKTVTLRQRSDTVMTVEAQAPLALEQRELTQALLKTNLATR